MQPRPRPDVHDAILNDRGGTGRRAALEAHAPHGSEVRDGVGIDLVEGRVSRVGPVSTDEGPIGAGEGAAVLRMYDQRPAHYRQGRRTEPPFEIQAEDLPLVHALASERVGPELEVNDLLLVPLPPSVCQM